MQRLSKKKERIDDRVISVYKLDHNIDDEKRNINEYLDESDNDDKNGTCGENSMPSSTKEHAEDEPKNNRERMMLRVEKLLHGMFTKINSLETQQEISDAIKVLEKADLDIKEPEIKMDELTERLKIASELFEERQNKEIKKKEKKEKENEEFERKRIELFLEEKEIDLQQKKRKLNMFVREDPSSSGSDIKTEKSVSHYDSVITYRNSKKDVAFNWIYISPKNVIAAIHNVGADGNCGFRAVALEVYNDQIQWLKVKHQMLQTYIQYHDTLYKPVDEKSIELCGI
ncbi:hypothetical protein INT47_007379 [Mucor saturninus]|uniref:OTU domain-containing protein n=1 Tax=Mucor saturninus TaxID=64648 RepID=A0A8H7QYL6_9FUNG|nr:hypothetical protein INT47_007379 [Mucor saturninus]